MARVVNFDSELALDILRWYKSKRPGVEVVVDAGFHMYSYPEYAYLEKDTLYVCALCEAELSKVSYDQLVMHESLEYEITKERVKCFSRGCAELMGRGIREAGPPTILGIRAEAHEELLISYPEYKTVLPEISRVHSQHYQYFLKEAFG